MERKKKSLTLLQNPQKGVDNKRNEKNKQLFIAKCNNKKLHIFKANIIYYWKKSSSFLKLDLSGVPTE